MYHHSSSRNSSTQGYYYTEHQYSPETNETPAYGAPNYRPASPQSQNYYNYASIPQQFSSGYSVVPPSSPPPRSYTATPLAIAHQTDQTLTALASARRLSREYMKESSSPTSRSSYYEAPSQHQSRMGDPSSAYTMRSPRLGTAPPSTSMGNPKPVEGHACRCCGKVFGRPSALKIHMAIHTGEKAYICPEAGCHRCFSVRSNMSRHIRNVHQIWPDGREEASDSSGDEAEER